MKREDINERYEDYHTDATCEQDSYWACKKMIFSKTGIKTDMHLKELCVSTNDGKITAHINADISVDTKDFETVIKRLK